MSNNTSFLNNSCTVTGKKNHYLVVGDQLYTGTGDVIPPWLNKIINDFIDKEFGSKIQETEDLKDSLVDALETIERIEGDLTGSVETVITDTTAVVESVRDLTQTVDNNSASIRNLLSISVTASEVKAIAENSIETSLGSGSIRASLNGLQYAISDLDSAVAGKIDSLESRFTTLGSQLGDLDFTMTNAFSELGNKITALEGEAGTDFSYNSELQLFHQGQMYYYKSGFGLKTVLRGSDYPGQIGMGSAEFWINATNFRFTNESGSGSVTPFAIDATGSSPEITFQGKVSFLPTALGYSSQADLDQAISQGRTVIQGGRINTDLIRVGTDTLIKNGYINTKLIKTDELVIGAAEEIADALGYNNASDLEYAVNNNNTIIKGGYINTSLIRADELLVGKIPSAPSIYPTLGYDSEAAMEVAKTTGSTIIRGGYINTNLIRVGSNTLIKDGMINTSLINVNELIVSGVGTGGSKEDPDLYKKLGYPNKPALDLAIAGSQTIIKGGYLNTGLIETDTAFIKTAMIGTAQIQSLNLANGAVTYTTNKEEGRAVWAMNSTLCTITASVDNTSSIIVNAGVRGTTSVFDGTTKITFWIDGTKVFTIPLDEQQYYKTELHMLQIPPGVHTVEFTLGGTAAVVSADAFIDVLIIKR